MYKLSTEPTLSPSSDKLKKWTVRLLNILSQPPHNYSVQEVSEIFIKDYEFESLEDIWICSQFISYTFYEIVKQMEAEDILDKYNERRNTN